MTSNCTVAILNGSGNVVKSHIMTEKEAWEYNHVQLLYELYYPELTEQNYQMVIEQ